MTDVINVGSTDNDGNGDTLRAAFSQINTRFNELLSTIDGGDAWATGVTYTATPIRQWVIESGQAYVAAVNHVSGATFAADLAAGKWYAVDSAQLRADLLASSGAGIVGFTPTGTIASTTVQTAIAEINTDLAASSGASIVGYLPAGTGAVATTVQSKLRERISVLDFPANGVSGARVDPSGVIDSGLGIQAAIDYVSSTWGDTLHFPQGTYLHANTIVFKNRIIYKGAGQEVTYLRYTGSGDQVQINNPINSNTAAYITVEDLGFLSVSTAVSKKANIADVGSTYLELNRCNFIGNDYGVILDQSELVLIQGCVFAQHTTGSIWLVNGDEHTPLGADYYTNRITIRTNQFNESGTCDLIVDDGGTVHTIENNNFNAGRIQIRVAGPRNLRITGNEFEACTLHGIYFTTLKQYGVQTATGNGVEVVNNFLVGSSSASYPHNSLIDFEVNCLRTLEMHSNTFYQQLGMAIPTTDPRPYVITIVAYNNLNEGTLVDSLPFNNNNIDFTWTPSVGGSTSLGVGTYTTRLARHTQNNNIITFQIEITWSAHTGSGPQIYVSLPFPAIKNTVGYTPVSIVINDITLASGEQPVALLNHDSAPFGQSGVIQLYKSTLGVLSPLAMQSTGSLYITGSYVSK